MVVTLWGVQGGGSRLSHHARELMAAARARGETSVTLLIATVPVATSSVASSLGGLGGNVRYRHDELGYIRVIVGIDRVEAAAAIAGVQAVELDEVIPLEDPRPQAVDDTTQVDPPGPGTPAENAYMPTRDIGAPQFISANPTYDGRGVTIGIVDLGVDLLTPELQTAKLLNGAAARKVVDWVTFTDPLTDNDPTWINMQTQVSGGTFTVGGLVYSAPAAGSFRFGLFNERDPRLGGELQNDVNRDGNPAGSNGIFAVLWKTTTNTVWVDTNQNRSFADEKPMTDYKVQYDMGVFGVDNPATALRETVPFVVQTDGKAKFVNIGIVSGAHGTHVAGIAAGKNFFGGAFDGVAPEAQVVSVRACLFVAGCTSHALLEGMIYTAKQANVDVINMSIGGLPALNDGNTTRAILYNRLIEQTAAQMFLSAGNSGPGLNTVGDPSVAGDVISVGAYVHSDTWLSNYGAVAAKTDGLFVFSSRGPREDGGFKPDIIAPGAAVSSIPAWQPGSPVPGTYALPPGYGMFNGTSMAAPQAAGAAALLISAAKQAGAQYQPEQLRQAFDNSSRYLPAYGAHEQGNGLLQVADAWEVLRTNVKTVAISSVAPVNTVLSGFLATPSRGSGIYEREGWAPGDSAQRVITFTRTKGPARASYNVVWVGNDGTFSSAAAIGLPLNTPVDLPVTVSPATAGAHSAILNLYDSTDGAVVYQVMNTVIAAHRFTAAGNYTASQPGSADRPDSAAYYFEVPPNAPAFKVDLAIGAGSRVRLLRFHPFGLPFDNLNTTPYQTGGSISRTVINPAPGVWEVTVDTSRTSAASPAVFTVSASILGASVSPDPDVIPSATLGVPLARAYTITNLFGAFTGRATGTTLGSARRGTLSIAHQAQQQFAVNVSAGTTSLRATIGNPSDPAADLDLFVFNCTTGTCVPAAQNADGDSEESVTINNPAAGDWVVLVVAFSVPAGTTTYDYVDVFTNPAFGAVSITDANALRPSGSSWVVPGTVSANAAPAAGRVLLGNVQVRTDTNVLIGSGEVIIQTVVP